MEVGQEALDFLNVERAIEAIEFPGSLWNQVNRWLDQLFTLPGAKAYFVPSVGPLLMNGDFKAQHLLSLSGKKEVKKLTKMGAIITIDY